MMNPWVILALVVAFVTQGLGAYFYCVDTGETEQDAKWQERENVELKTANAKILELTTKARADEAKAAIAQAAISEDYEGKLKNVQDDKDKFVSDVRAGRIVLRIPQPAAAKRAGGGASSQAAASPGQCDGEARGELPREVTEFLYGEAGRADSIVEQLTACQALVKRDRNE